MRKQLTARQQLDNLADALIDDIMAMSDEEIRAEAIEDGIDIEQNAKDMQMLFEKAIAQSNAAMEEQIEREQGWRVDLVAFRLALGSIANQDMTIRQLRRLLLSNRKAGTGLIATPEGIARHINSLPPLEYP
jgi:hypothetical protein